MPPVVPPPGPGVPPPPRPPCTGPNCAPTPPPVGPPPPRSIPGKPPIQRYIIPPPTPPGSYQVVCSCGYNQFALGEGRLQNCGFNTDACIIDPLICCETAAAECAQRTGCDPNLIRYTNCAPPCGPQVPWYPPNDTSIDQRPVYDTRQPLPPLITIPPCYGPQCGAELPGGATGPVLTLPPPAGPGPVLTLPPVL